MNPIALIQHFVAHAPRGFVVRSPNVGYRILNVFCWQKDSYDSETC